MDQGIRYNSRHLFLLHIEAEREANQSGDAAFLCFRFLSRAFLFVRDLDRARLRSDDKPNERCIATCVRVFITDRSYHST
jgi:hypothetical protein